jgi:hypothetical protein
MAERFFARLVGLENATTFDSDLRNNQGVVKTTITYTPVSERHLVATFYNDIPVLTLAAGATVEYEYGSDVPNWDTLTDVTDGDHSSAFTYTYDASTLDMDTIGVYTVPVTVTDASGNASEPLEIEITIVDTTVPVISDAETLVTSYVTGSPVPSTWLTGITASDEYDGDITADIVVDDSAVDMDTVGTFAITYNVDDASGNSAVELSKTITITAE